MNLQRTLLLLVWLSFAPTPVQADILTLKLRPKPGVEIQVKPISGFSSVPEGLGMTFAGLFPTFSVEKGWTGGYHHKLFAELNDEAVGGGSGSAPDPLDPKTAYLYQRFIDGDLSGYDYGYGLTRTLSAIALQEVIWFIEDEQAWDTAWIPGTLQHAFYQDALANAGPGIGHVRIMNLYRNAGLTKERQDHLVIMPAPGAALLGMIGLFLAGLRKRRC